MNKIVYATIGTVSEMFSGQLLILKESGTELE